jgi:outer membrane protein OmpA-like peptidoglycan-associated protein
MYVQVARTRCIERFRTYARDRVNRLIVLAMLWSCRHSAVPEVAEATTPARPEPRPGRTVVTSSDVQILDPIRFEGLSAKITITSIPFLDSLASTFHGNPNIRLVEVIAYGSDGLDEFQQTIAEHRAQSIVDALVKRGVEPARLRAHGIAKPTGGASNLPVFVILERR